MNNTSKQVVTIDPSHSWKVEAALISINVLNIWKKKKKSLLQKNIKNNKAFMAILLT